MKNIFILFSIIYLFSLIALGNKQVPGYFINNNNDTIRCTFRLPQKKLSKAINFTKMQWVMQYTDINGTTLKIKPADVKEYGFILDSIVYTYLSRKNNIKIMRSVFADNSNVFLRLCENGSLKLFNYHENKLVPASGNAGFLVNLFIKRPKKNFCLQKNDELITNFSKLFFKKEILDYLNDCVVIQEKIRNNYNRDDIEIIVREYNNNCGN